VASLSTHKRQTNSCSVTYTPDARLSTIRYTSAMEPATAGVLLRQARKRAGLSQVDLAARAGVTQSVISAYESGQRQPSIPALTRLVDAAGFELTLGLRRPPGRLRRLSGPVGRRVRRHRKDLAAAAAAHGVRNLRVFGSVARGEDRPDSDVDLLADFPPGLSLFRLGRLEADLEAILGTRVDLIPAADLEPGVREQAESDLIAL
jgi:predicted nucleotidyltransferase/DNA-binding transcriptional regulator YiaG